jgi:hypothetical protein
MVTLFNPGPPVNPPIFGTESGQLQSSIRIGTECNYHQNPGNHRVTCCSQGHLPS